MDPFKGEPYQGGAILQLIKTGWVPWYLEYGTNKVLGHGHGIKIPQVTRTRPLVPYPNFFLMASVGVNTTLKDDLAVMKVDFVTKDDKMYNYSLR